MAAAAPEQWSELNRWLSRHQPFWRPAPFHTPAPDWASRADGLRRLVEGLADRECEYYQEHLHEFAAMAARWIPGLAERGALIRLPELGGTLPERLPGLSGTPRRKARQTHHFVAAVAPLFHPVVDWCCGKGHLARALARAVDQGVLGLERNPELVRDGNALAASYAPRVRLAEQDVLAPELSLPADHHVAALHACGELHRELMRKAAHLSLPRISFSPCCYHLVPDGDYGPLSQRVLETPDRLRPDRETLRLAVQDTVTAPPRVRELRRRANAWRLGFDGLQRAVRGLDAYLPVPTHPAALMTSSFPEFCEWAAAQRQVPLPASTDHAYWEAHGYRREQQVTQHELIRHLFRRPLEIWLVLDHVCFLEEQGYEVTLGTFCSRQLTPRNLLVDARRRSAS